MMNDSARAALVEAFNFATRKLEQELRDTGTCIVSKSLNDEAIDYFKERQKTAFEAILTVKNIRDQILK